MKSPRRIVIRVFISSTTDLSEHDGMAHEAADFVAKNVRSLKPELPTEVEVFRWGVDARRGAGDPQSVLNRDLDRADIVVFLVWKRVGVGMMEEFWRAHRRWKRSGAPELLLYFCEAPFKATNRAQRRDRAAVARFRKKVSHTVLFASYKNLYHLKLQVLMDLNRLVAGHIERVISP